MFKEQTHTTVSVKTHFFVTVFTEEVSDDGTMGEPQHVGEETEYRLCLLLSA